METIAAAATLERPSSVVDIGINEIGALAARAEIAPLEPDQTLPNIGGTAAKPETVLDLSVEFGKYQVIDEGDQPKAGFVISNQSGC